jgi:hypothetical protein
MLRSSILGVLVVLAITGVTFGQEFPKPGAEHEKLKELVGTWDAVMDMGGQKTKATAVYKSICNGMWVESDFEGNLGGAKFQGRGLDGYDLKAKKYVSVWVDSMESAPMHFTGDYDATGKQLVMTGESRTPEGKPQKFKNVTIPKDNDHFTFKMYMVDADGKENLAFTIDYTRRK